MKYGMVILTPRPPCKSPIQTLMHKLASVHTHTNYSLLKLGYWQKVKKKYGLILANPWEVGGWVREMSRAIYKYCCC